MLLYRARLEEAPARVLSVTVRPAHRLPGLAGGTMRQVDIRLRYATGSGAVLLHRGRLHCNWAEEEAPQVTGWQEDGNDLFISLAPASQERPASGAPRVQSSPPACDHGPLTQTGRLILPFALHHADAQADSSASAALYLRAAGQGRSVSARGTVTVSLITPAGQAEVRVPFTRLERVQEGGTVPGAWQCLGKVSGLRVEVPKEGWITGEVAVDIWLVRRAEHQANRLHIAGLQQVREAQATITQVVAESAVPGEALLRGQIALDLYWVDTAGRVRWIDRMIPFTQLIPLPGLEAQDRLEAAAFISHVRHHVKMGLVIVDLMIRTRLTALRADTVVLASVEYSLERIIGRAEADLLVSERFEAPISDSSPGGSVPEMAGARIRGFVPLPGPIRSIWWLELEQTAGGGLILAAVVRTRGQRPECRSRLRWVRGPVLGPDQIPLRGSETIRAVTASPVQTAQGDFLLVSIETAVAEHGS